MDDIGGNDYGALFGVSSNAASKQKTTEGGEIMPSLGFVLVCVVLGVAAVAAFLVLRLGVKGALRSVCTLGRRDYVHVALEQPWAEDDEHYYYR